eukprot:8978099-Pyramimonas_sp.AAC.1
MECSNTALVLGHRGRAEAASVMGGWVKDLMVKGAEQSMVVTEKDLETLAYEVVSGKNNYLHRGGFSPNQLAFGRAPRMRQDILSDDGANQVGLDDRAESSWDKDTAAADFSKSMAIR